MTALIPLYAIGVFLSFTMSQLGMVVRWRKIGRLAPDDVVETKGSRLQYDPQWRRRIAVNALGALVTFGVMVVQAVTKITQGAWIVVLLIPMLVWIFFRIQHHYDAVRRQLSVSLRSAHVSTDPMPLIHLVLISDVHMAALRQIQFVRSLGGNWEAVHVATDEAKAAQVAQKWRQDVPDGRLVTLPSPFRDLVGPVREYVETLHEQHPEAMIHVVMAQLLMDNFPEQALHQNTTVILKLALQHIPGVAVTDVAFPLPFPVDGDGNGDRDRGAGRLRRWLFWAAGGAAGALAGFGIALLQGAIRYQEIFGLSFLVLLAAALFLAFVRAFFPTGGRI